jgi:hypothetical protein
MASNDVSTNDNEQKQQKQQQQLNEIHQLLESVYYNLDSPSSYKSIDVLLNEINKIQRENQRPKVKRGVVTEWLSAEPTWSEQRKIELKFPRNRYKLPEKNAYHIQIDLADVHRYASENDGTHFLLVAIDLRSRYAFVEKLQSKDAQAALKGLQNILAKIPPQYKVVHLQGDAGKEWKNKFVQTWLKSQDINFFVAGKPVFVERFIQTLMKTVYRVMTRLNSRRFVDVLEKIVSNYNASKHRGISQTPKDVWTGEKEPKPFKYTAGEIERYQKAVERDHKNLMPIKTLVRVGHNPLEGSQRFDKGFYGRWSTELFRVRNRKIKDGERVLYSIESLPGESIDETFYSDELNPVNERFMDKPREIDRIIRYRKLRGREREALVTFKSWPTNHYEWISESGLTDI